MTEMVANVSSNSAVAKRVAKNTTILYIRMAITVLVSLYITRLILSALGLSDFGIYNIVGSVIAMMTFINTSMASASQRFMSFAEGAGQKDQQIKIFNVSITLHLIISIFMVICLEVIALFFFDRIIKIDISRLHAAEWIFQVMIINTVITIISVPFDAVINAHEDMLFYAILSIGECLLRLLVAIYISHSVSGDKLIIYGVSMALIAFLLFIIRIIYCSVRYQECVYGIRRFFDRALFNSMFTFAGWSFLGASTSMVAFYGQGIVLNNFFGVIVNSAQGIASQVNGQLSAFSTTMLKALNPVISKAEGGGQRRLMHNATLIGSIASFFLLFIFIAPVIFDADFLLSIWLKQVPPYAIIFCKLLLIQTLIESLFATLSSSISAVGNIKVYQVFNSIINILPLPLAYLLFKLNFPPFYLYISFIAYAVLKGSETVFFAVKLTHLPLREYAAKVILPAFLSTTVVFTSLYWITIVMHPSILRTIIMFCLTFFLSFGILGYSAFSKSQRSEIFVRLNALFINFVSKARNSRPI